MMNTIIRKIHNVPSKINSIRKEILYLLIGLKKSILDEILIKRILKNSLIQLKASNGVAVINAGRSLPVSDIELYFGYILSRAGYKTYVLFDDGVLEHWDSAQSNNLKYFSPYKARKVIRLSYRLRNIILSYAYKHKNLKIIYYSKVLGEMNSKTKDLSQYKHYALSSTKRFYQEGFLDTNGKHQSYYKKSLQNCAVSHQVATFILKKLKPDLFITSHGIYSVWGPAYNLIKTAGIPIAVWQVPGTSNQKIRIIDRQDAILAQTNDWKEYDLETPDEDEKIINDGYQILESRTKHKTEDTAEYFEPLLSKKEDNIRDTSSSKINFGMFPNVVWDGDVPERNIMFDNVVDWCESTIKLFKALENLHLYIRFHPAEVTRLKGTVKLEDVIRERIPEIDKFDNITLIASSDAVDSYKFAQNNIDIGLIYDGHLSLELTHIGIPVIACTNGNFTPDSIVYKPSTKKEYKDWLSTPKKLIKRFEKEKRNRQNKARKFAYWEFYDSLLDFTPLEKPYPAKINYNLVKNGNTHSQDEEKILKRLLKDVIISH
jgi:hypothetical protein